MVVAIVYLSGYISTQLKIFECVYVNSVFSFDGVLRNKLRKEGRVYTHTFEYLQIQSKEELTHTFIHLFKCEEALIHTFKHLFKDGMYICVKIRTSSNVCSNVFVCEKV